MREISLEELRTIQLDVLQAIHEFCQKQGITYSLACGTALGAVRHKGYIPWDDDIDIYLLRDDYNKLMQIYPKDTRYKVISMERDNQWDRPYAKAFDADTIFEEQRKSKTVIGVGIDVYPIDKVPEKYEEWRFFDRRRRFYHHVLGLKHIKFNKNRSLWKNLMLLVGKTLLLPISNKRLICFIDKYIKKYNNTESQWVFESAQGLIQKNRFCKKVFENVVPVDFEDRKFMLFKDYDEYLKNGYGDYMKLPPIEKQVAHHAYKAYWK